MKRLMHIVGNSMLAFILVSAARVAAQGTAFTYQGRLNDGGGAASGSYDLRFAVYDAGSGGNLIAGPLTNSATGVTNGLFAVVLDFGPSVFSGPGRWLEIGVRTNSGSPVAFTTLGQRQAMTASPYAIFANAASNISGTISSANLSGTYSSPVTFSNGANTFDGTFIGQFLGSTFTGGTFTGNFIGTGSGLMDVWHTGGNFGTTAGPNFLGTSDNQPLVIKVNGNEAMRYEPTYETPNIIGGWSGNSVQPNLTGVTIGGGGSSAFFAGKPQPNVVTNGGYYATIAGGYNNAVTNYGGAILGGSVHLAGGNFATIGAGQFNTNLGNYSFIGGGYLNAVQQGSGYAVLGGGYDNTIQANGFAALIAGGYQNVIQTNAQAAVISGGAYNMIGTNAFEAVIAGGYGNTNQYDAFNCFIGSGLYNLIQHDNYDAAIVSGYYNTIETTYGAPFIGAGAGNTIKSYAAGAVIVGGESNQVGGVGAFIGGGGWDGTTTGGNTNNGDAAAIVGGMNNAIQFGGNESFIGSGVSNLIDGASFASISGGNNNKIRSLARGSSIGGGELNSIQADVYTTGTGSVACAIGGGYGNTIQTNSAWSLVGGGYFNTIQPYASGTTIAGGAFNTIQGHSNYWGTRIFDTSTIGGGAANTIQSNSAYATIAGGVQNVIRTNSTWSTIGGGAVNAIETNSAYSVVAGGTGNTAGGGGSAATVSGGSGNVAFGAGATVAGGWNNLAQGNASFAAGTQAKALHDGSWVWADYEFVDFPSTAPNQFLIRATGGVGINTNNPNGAALNVNGLVTASGFAGNGSSLTGVNASTVNGLSSSSFWSTTGNAGTTAGPNFVGTTDGRPLLIKGSFVGINRVSALTTAEAFGIDAPPGVANYGGMYVNMSIPAGKPFYGYSLGTGTVSAWSYMDGTDTNKWKLNVGVVDRITVTQNGLVGIGTTVPDATLSVNGTADKPGGGPWTTFSDVRLKKNIQSLTGALDRLMELRAVTFEYKDPQSIHELPGVQIGMIAQEVEKVFPDWVDTAPNGMKRLSIHGFEALTVEALRELRAEKDAKLSELEKGESELRKELAEARAELSAQKEIVNKMAARFDSLEKAMAHLAGKSSTELSGDVVAAERK